ncbi:hypothetical protein Dimus_024311 [Dionaea muscipula]
MVPTRVDPIIETQNNQHAKSLIYSTKAPDILKKMDAPKILRKMKSPQKTSLPLFQNCPFSPLLTFIKQTPSPQPILAKTPTLHNTLALYTHRLSQSHGQKPTPKPHELQRYHPMIKSKKTRSGNRANKIPGEQPNNQRWVFGAN